MGPVQSRPAQIQTESAAKILFLARCSKPVTPLFASLHCSPSVMACPHPPYRRSPLLCPCCQPPSPLSDFSPSCCPSCLGRAPCKQLHGSLLPILPSNSPVLRCRQALDKGQAAGELRARPVMQANCESLFLVRPPLVCLYPPPIVSCLTERLEALWGVSLFGDCAAPSRAGPWARTGARGHYTDTNS